ncbi:hypothetical protein ACFQWC_06515 [Rossellomorea sp. GCM10028870]|uniref:hypothetical protein n=1 Tax=Rossellomorea sp. GCM10028870 TaxID=3273426 RepID=UPI00361EFD5F
MNFYWMSRNLVEIDSFDEVLLAGLANEKILSAKFSFYQRNPKYISGIFILSAKPNFIPKPHPKYRLFNESYAYIIFSIAYGDFFM